MAIHLHRNSCGGHVKLVLLADDSRFLRLANERVLVRGGYRVITAADGEQALRLARAQRPDLIMLDMLLPKLSGRDVLRELRNHSLTAHIPIIVLSSLPQTNAQKLLAEGAAAYLEKSRLDLGNNPNVLLEIVSATIERQTSTPLVRAQKAAGSK